MGARSIFVSLSLTFIKIHPRLRLVIRNFISRECYMHAVQIGFSRLMSLPSADCVQSRFPCYHSFAHFCTVNP